MGSFLFAGESSEGGENNIKQSLAYVQLERQNERLKEALVRYARRSCYIHVILTVLTSLRDITSESEAENRRRIADMEKDISTLDELQGECIPDVTLLESHGNGRSTT